MMTATQDQLGALAALVGINDKTHPHLFCHHLGEGMKLVPEWLPALDTDAGDDVFLAPTMRWCASKRMAVITCAHYTGHGASINHKWFESKSGTVMNIIRAFQAAGVEEIIAIFGRGDHDAR